MVTASETGTLYYVLVTADGHHLLGTIECREGRSGSTGEDLGSYSGHKHKAGARERGRRLVLTGAWHRAAQGGFLSVPFLVIFTNGGVSFIYISISVMGCSGRTALQLPWLQPGRRGRERRRRSVQPVPGLVRIAKVLHTGAILVAEH